MCAEHCGKSSPAAHGAHRAAALLHILVCFVRLWCAKPRKSVCLKAVPAREAQVLTAACTSGVFVTVMNKLYKGNDRQRHAMLVPVTQVATRIVMWCCGYSARRCCALFRCPPAPDAAPALQLTINGAANLAAAQREAAASNSSYEIVRRSPNACRLGC